MKAKRVAKRANFVSPNEKAKSEVIAQLVRIARKARLGYDDFLYVSQQTRRKLGLRRVLKQRRLPQLLTEAELKRFFRAIQDCGDVQHEIADVDLRGLQDLHQSGQGRQLPPHPVPGELPPGAQKPPECHAPQSLPIRDTTVRA